MCDLALQRQAEATRMNNPSELVKECVLRAISDDYENLEKILEDVGVWLGERKALADDSTVIGALGALIDEGYAQTYDLSSHPLGEAKAVSYSAKMINELWFYVTPKGKKLARSFQENWRL